MWKHWATIFVRIVHIIKKNPINVIGPSRFMKNPILLQLIIPWDYAPLSQLSNDYSYSSIWSLRWKLWPFEKAIFTQFVHFFHLCNLTRKLLSTSEENMSRTREIFVSSVDNIHDDEHTSTFRLSIYCSSNILQQSGIGNFILFTISSNFEFLVKLAISQTEHFWKNFTKENLFGFMSR